MLVYVLNSLEQVDGVEIGHQSVQISPAPIDGREHFIYAGAEWTSFVPADHFGVKFGRGLPHETIEVGRIDQSLYERADRIVQSLLTGGFDGAATATDNLVSILGEDPRLGPRLRATPFLKAVLNILPGGLRSTTYCTVRKRYVGLHFDDFGDHAERSVTLGSLRLCVNLSSQPRYFCFASVGFDEACSEMMIPEQQLQTGQKVSGLATRYCIRRQPRIYRITFQPGQYYLAPTQNLIHDGQTHPALQRDVSLAMRIGVEPQ